MKILLTKCQTKKIKNRVNDVERCYICGENFDGRDKYVIGDFAYKSFDVNERGIMFIIVLCPDCHQALVATIESRDWLRGRRIMFDKRTAMVTESR